MTDCMDLRPWAKANRYRWRFEESYRAEQSTEARGDGRWYVEIPCRYGLIYPHGGSTLLAYATRGVKRHVEALDGTEHHQHDDGAEVFRFPAELLDQVAAILKPRRRRSVTLTPERAEMLRERMRRINQERRDSQTQRTENRRERTFETGRGVT